MLFQHCRCVGQAGAGAARDLRGALACYFDTVNGGNKREASSYGNILASLGLGPREAGRCMFVTDVLAEARAAAAAGMRVVVSVREGNAALEAGHGFRTIRSFDELFAS